MWSAVAAGRNRSQRGVRYMDIVDLVVSADLERVAGWRGMTAMVDVLNAKGGRANNIANTLQGVDNSEVSDNQTRCSRPGCSRASPATGCRCWSGAMT